MNMKQQEIKIEPRIKLSYNIDRVKLQQRQIFKVALYGFLGVSLTAATL